ncbi:MAG TPA: hypothetical protein PKE40_02230 [Arachnia sp.]|nr:hypothetical protein [Arachnia sp.]HMT85147.1 hypothetical protein [Arachnia sp.]
MIEGYFAFGLGPMFVGVLCLVILLARSQGRSSVQLIDWSLLFIGLVHGLFAPFVLRSIIAGPAVSTGDRVIQEKFGEDLTYHSIVVVSALIGLLLGWEAVRMIKARRADRSPVEPVRATSGWSLERWFWIMAAVAVLSQYLYTRDYGGFSGVFDYAQQVRAGALDESVRSRFSFLSPLAGFSMLACYGFFGLFLERSSRNIRTFLGAASTFAFSLYVLASWQGRVALVVFVGSLLLGVLLFARLNRLAVILGSGVFFVLGIASVAFVSGLLDRGEETSRLGFFTEQVSFVFSGFWAWAGGTDITYRYFYDLVVSPMFLLPSSMTLGDFTRISDVHTALMLGAAKGSGDIYGAMPLDLMTMGYSQLGLFGVVMYAAIFGAVLYLLQAWVDRIPNNGVRAVLEAYLSLRIAGIGMFYAEPEHLIRGNLPLVVSLILMALFGKRRRRAPSLLGDHQASISDERSDKSGRRF